MVQYGIPKDVYNSTKFEFYGTIQCTWLVFIVGGILVIQDGHTEMTFIMVQNLKFYGMIWHTQMIL